MCRHNSERYGHGLSRSDASGVDNLGGWLTTIVARVCLSVLRSRTRG